MHARYVFWLIFLLVAAGCDRGVATSTEKVGDRRAGNSTETAARRPRGLGQAGDDDVSRRV